MRVFKSFYLSCVLLCSVLFFSSEAFALSNKHLMERCKSVINADFDFSKTSKSEDEWNFQFCIGYMIGITHAFDGNCHDVTSMDVWKENASARTVIFQKVYAADNEDPDASIQAFMNWVTKNPDKWDNDAPYTTYLWLAETFPCD